MVDQCVNELWINGPQAIIDELITTCINVPSYYISRGFVTKPVLFSFSGLAPLSEEAIIDWESNTDPDRVLWEGFSKRGVSGDPIGPFVINRSIPDEFYIKFKTNRMEPEWFFQLMTSLYPDLTFRLEYYQGVANFAGEMHAVGGAVTTHRHWDMSNQEREDRGLPAL